MLNIVEHIFLPSFGGGGVWVLGGIQLSSFALHINHFILMGKNFVVAVVVFYLIIVNLMGFHSIIHFSYKSQDIMIHEMIQILGDRCLRAQ